MATSDRVAALADYPHPTGLCQTGGGSGPRKTDTPQRSLGHLWGEPSPFLSKQGKANRRHSVFRAHGCLSGGTQTTEIPMTKQAMNQLQPGLKARRASRVTRLLGEFMQSRSPSPSPPSNMLARSSSPLPHPAVLGALQSQMPPHHHQHPNYSPISPTR